jgi:hypothetical protein
MVTIARVNASKTYGRARRVSRGRRWQRRAGRARRTRVASHPLFLASSTQHVSRAPSAGDWLGGVATIAAAAVWGVLALLVVG